MSENESDDQIWRKWKWKSLQRHIFGDQYDGQYGDLYIDHIIELCSNQCEDSFNQNIGRIKDQKTLDQIFMGMCMFNHNENIIKQMVECVGCSVNQITSEGQTPLSLACRYNENQSVIQYLIVDSMQDPDHADIYGQSCFLNACYFNRNYLLIAIYLIESTDAKISLTHVPSFRWGRIILGIKNNFERFNQVLDLGLKEYNQDKYDQKLLNLIVPRINPMLLILRRDLLTKYCIRDPFDNMFLMKDFIKFTDDLNCSLPITIPVSVHISMTVSTNTLVPPITILSLDQDEESDNMDSMKHRSRVFVYNGDNYYADPEIVFNQITLFKEIKDILRFDVDELVVLSCGSYGPCPRYLINLWLGSMCTKKIDLMEIESNHILSALDHIDRYPTESVSIRGIEHQLIRRIDRMITCGELTDCQWITMSRYLTDLCARYGLKYMYIWIHNHKIKESR
jgi:hypothetical protein